MTPRVPISCGELIDKITILEIKSEPLLGTPRIWSRMAVLRCSAALAPVSCHAAAERRCSFRAVCQATSWRSGFDCSGTNTQCLKWYSPLDKIERVGVCAG
jgi:hypothetical protein